MRALLAMVPRQSQLPRMDSIQMDSRVVLFALGLSILSAIAFGLAPSLQVSQIDPRQALQAGATRTAKTLLRRLLVVAEISLSLILLIGAGLMLRSFQKLVSVNPGFETEHILTMEMFTSPAKYNDDRKRAAYFTNILGEVRTVPGVRDVGSVHFLPLEERTSGSCFSRQGDPPPVPSTAPSVDFLVVSPGYFQTMGTPLITGRHFDDHDRFGTRSVVMVNKEFVGRFLSDRNPIGQTLNLCWTVQNPAEIVGVTGDARQKQLNAAPKPTIFINNLQAPMYFAQLVVRTSGGSEQNRTCRGGRHPSCRSRSAHHSCPDDETSVLRFRRPAQSAVDIAAGIRWGRWSACVDRNLRRSGVFCDAAHA
jgi:putative ABC transport system permease protein